MNHQNAISVKASLDNDLRKFSVPRDTPLADLHDLLRSRFAISESDLSLKWKDEDGDHITIINDADLAEALSFEKVRLILSLRTSAKTKPADKPEPAQPGVNPANNEVKKNLTAIATAFGLQLPNHTLNGLSSGIADAATKFESLARDFEATQKAHTNKTSTNKPHCRGPCPSDMFNRFQGHPFVAHITEQVKSATQNILTAQEAEAAGEAVHWGVYCDKTHTHPIVGPRWHMQNENFDLCDSEFQKLDEVAKHQFECIKQPGDKPITYTTPNQSEAKAEEPKAKAAKEPEPKAPEVPKEKAAEEVEAQAADKVEATAAEEPTEPAEPEQPEAVQHIIAMGFSPEQAAVVLAASDNNVELAVSMLLDMPVSEPISKPAPEPQQPCEPTPEAPELPEEAEPSEEKVTNTFTEEWVDLMTELVGMGFEDPETNHTALTEANGDIKGAVKALIQQERESRK